MLFNNIKHNLIIIFCILLMVNGCNDENSKLIIENNKIEETKKPNIQNKSFFNKNNLKRELLKSKRAETNYTKLKEKNNNIIFEFRNERLLQGRDNHDNIFEKKKKLALSAVQKMFKKNLSYNNTELNLINSNNFSLLSRYTFENNKTIEYKNIRI